MIKAVIFDLDGTLLDSVETIYEVWMKFCDRLNLKRLDLNSFRNSYDTDWLEFSRLILQKDISVGTKEHFLWMDIYNELRDKIVLHPGMKDFLRRLKEENYKIALVTGGNKDRVRKELARFGILDFFDVIVAHEDAPIPKPSPLGLLTAAKKLDVSPHECVYIGDMMGDVVAARNAGMFAVAVDWGFHEKNQLRSAGALHIAQSVYDLNYLLKNIGE